MSDNGVSDEVFAAEIRAHYANKGGLTGVFAIGGTRTTYILGKQRHLADPGHMDDLSDQIEYVQQRYIDFIPMFFNLGGQNLIIAGSSFRAFAGQRGPEYTAWISEVLRHLYNDAFQQMYRECNIDPYFIGIDVFLTHEEGSATRKLGEDIQAFLRSWKYAAGRYKLV